VITDVRTLALSGWTDAIDPPARVFQTLFFSKPTKVTATATLSMTSIGHTSDTAGTAGAVIWKVGIARPTGGTDTVDLSDSFEHNSGTFERCVFITFALSLRKAAGVGQYAVFVDG
jgi:hypothetical protein